MTHLSQVRQLRLRQQFGSDRCLFCDLKVTMARVTRDPHVVQPQKAPFGTPGEETPGTETRHGSHRRTRVSSQT